MMETLLENLTSGSMVFLIRQTLIYAVPLMVVALAGVYAERSGVINLALEGIMIFGAFIGVLFVRLVQQWGWFDAAKAAGDWVSLQGFMLMTMAVAALLGAIFSLLLAFAAINLRADQTVGGTALNLLAPALVLFLIRLIANQNTLRMATGDSASWFMIKKSMFGYGRTGRSRFPLRHLRQQGLSGHLCVHSGVHHHVRHPLLHALRLKAPFLRRKSAGSRQPGHQCL